MSSVPSTLWQPRSDCGPECLPEPDENGSVSGVRQAVRFVALLGAVIFGVALLPVLPLMKPRGRRAAGRAWARSILAALEIRLVTKGRLPTEKALLVANHISWLDIVAVLAVAPAQMLAKHDVRDWPVIGRLAASAGTIFVDRTRPRALPGVVADVAAALRSGGVVAVFPEGTTWCGAMTGTFRPAMFQAALDAGAQVVPVAINYGERPTTVAFLGEDSLWVSLRRVLAVRRLIMSVTATPALHPEAVATRRQLARVAEAAVRTEGPVYQGAMGLAA
ncbi:lysophospholipid acyltransferase family protein [Phytohabitans flavus]|uniref:1-acyl-sn-glycerol-3-phosphate acyltransferase n=1 Tax=Phytohabitans flavus TaxID=1076124 RepID=A0A6F8Y6L4_9ACTN|nr:lysophospholipid acyltransferase family protein [Phytohabitans flavus]BCB81735.1 1-acyl-sn-glycerol-3-phosphate acyltransferase [Phytohabitans flavus]